jgi:hypothetical protein
MLHHLIGKARLLFLTILVTHLCLDLMPHTLIDLGWTRS